MPFLLFLLGVATAGRAGNEVEGADRADADVHARREHACGPSEPSDFAALVSGSNPATLDAVRDGPGGAIPTFGGAPTREGDSRYVRCPGRLRRPRFRRATKTDQRSTRSMPPAMVTFVHGELVNETDPARLRALRRARCWVLPRCLGPPQPSAAALAPTPAKSAAPTTSGPLRVRAQRPLGQPPLRTRRPRPLLACGQRAGV